MTLIDANLLESTVAESVKLSFIRWSFFNSTGGQQPRRLLEAAEEDGRIFHLYLTLFKRMMAGGQRPKEKRKRDEKSPLEKRLVEKLGKYQEVGKTKRILKMVGKSRSSFILFLNGCIAKNFCQRIVSQLSFPDQKVLG